eukprot:3822987-Rhodomonas_salina.3
MQRLEGRRAEGGLHLPRRLSAVGAGGRLSVVATATLRPAESRSRGGPEALSVDEDVVLERVGRLVVIHLKAERNLEAHDLVRNG